MNPPDTAQVATRIVCSGAPGATANGLFTAAWASPDSAAAGAAGGATAAGDGDGAGEQLARAARSASPTTWSSRRSPTSEARITAPVPGRSAPNHRPTVDSS